MCEKTQEDLQRRKPSKVNGIQSAVLVYVVHLVSLNKFNCSTQDSSLTIPKLRSNVKKFKELINGFVGENFFGTETGKLLDELDDDLMHGIRSKLESSFKKFYTDALDYLNKWFAFLDDFSFMDWLQLDKELSFADVSRTFTNLISNNAEEQDNLFTEVIEIKENLKKLEGTEFDQLDVSVKWLVCSRVRMSESVLSCSPAQKLPAQLVTLSNPISNLNSKSYFRARTK
uniref:Uncharacterized protein n=1 Tax=Ditylenchus dipsaci TaxID=166011 RepID=A0A915ETS7_9BILA